MTEYEVQINEKVNQLALSIQKMEGSLHEMRASLMENNRTGLQNIHNHLKEQMSDIRENIKILSKTIELMNKNLATKAELQDCITHSQCELKHVEMKNSYMTRSQLVKWMVISVGIIQAVSVTAWAMLKTTWPLLNQVIK